MSSRRWPIITLALILFNLAIFAGTHRTVDKQDSHLWTVRENILILAAKFPNLVLTTDAREWVSGYQRRFPDEWAEMQNPDSDPVDEWDARTKQIDDPAALQAEMDSLVVQYSQLSDSSITEQFAFAYAHPKPITYLTSTFLHMDWWHVLGNMWFLWLAGCLLEDAWGRPLYLLISLTAGALASQFNLWMAPGAFGYSLGASGAIAGLIGAFLVRFPHTKIRMMWFFDLGLFPFCRFWMRAYWLLPFWVLLEINSGMGPRDGVAHWAHVGGFLFGALAAIGRGYSGLERKIDQAIEQKVSWTAEAEIVRANDMMESGKLEEAAVILNEFLATNPD